uniref:Enoyl reductase (ER) domain-containing protein n=1 Tax=Pygocentrus nattereri TaxID=42514 RepID=A0A3B4DFW4_PYGNA
MKGLYCKLSEAGEVKFIIQETSVPTTIGNHQVKVQVKGCALSPVDIKVSICLASSAACSFCKEPCGVTIFAPDFRILPLDAEMSGLCDVVLIDEYNLVQKPEKVSWFEAAGAIKDALRAYTALHTLARMAVGHTLLVLDGASPFGLLAIQLAHYHGVKVLATAVSLEDQKFLEQLRPSVARVIGVWDSKVDLVDSCLEETGGLGVDIVIDTGVRLYEEESEVKKHLPYKHDIISLLGVGGHWVTTEDNLQLDPPDSRNLFLKAASVSFLNEEVWEASRARQGRYLHIMKDVVEKLATGTFRPLVENPVPLYEATVSMEMVQRRQLRKRVVVKL